MLIQILLNSREEIVKAVKKVLDNYWKRKTYYQCMYFITFIIFNLFISNIIILGCLSKVKKYLIWFKSWFVCLKVIEKTEIIIKHIMVLNNTCILSPFQSYPSDSIKFKFYDFIAYGIR